MTTKTRQEKATKYYWNKEKLSTMEELYIFFTNPGFG